jgi:hypothetical protein
MDARLSARAGIGARSLGGTWQVSEQDSRAVLGIEGSGCSDNRAEGIELVIFQA